MRRKNLTKLIVTIITASTLFSACLLSACFTHKHKHDPQYVDATEATCEKNGNTEYYVCSCGKCFSDKEALTEIERETTILQRKPHQFTVYGYDESVHYAKCAVCGFVKSGTEAAHVLRYSADEYAHYSYCSLCDYRTESEAHVPDEEGEEFCKICRYRRPEYQLSADGEYYICTGASQAFKDQITELVIPDTYMGLPVKEVGERAFVGCVNLERVTLGKNVVSIGDYAFMDNLCLNAVDFNNGLLEIRFRAFYGCSALEKVVLPPNLFIVGGGVFYGCSGLKKVIVPPSLKTVSERMFYECSALETVELHDGITSFGVASFSRTGLSLFTVPDGVAAVPQTMFYDCKNLETVTLPASVTSI
ncbi:MAG: leucine-rich repeat domain-containing protein, partial [Clostridia bacterium]|nr:leucine-rich repeat domain-containing protein [Clostridia bacterium]